LIQINNILLLYLLLLKKFKKKAFQRKLHHLISLFKTLRFPDTQKKEKKKVSVRDNEMMMGVLFASAKACK